MSLGQTYKPRVGFRPFIGRSYRVKQHQTIKKYLKSWFKVIPAQLDLVNAMKHQAVGWPFDGSLGVDTVENNAERLRRTVNFVLT